MARLRNRETGEIREISDQDLLRLQEQQAQGVVGSARVAEEPITGTPSTTNILSAVDQTTTGIPSPQPSQPAGGLGGFRKITKELLLQIQIDPNISASDKTAVQKIFEFQNEDEAKTFSPTEAETIARAKSGLRSLTRIRETLQGDPNTPELEGGGKELFGATTPFTPFGRALEADILNLSDAILRSRSGAAVPEEEVKKFAKILTPSLLESPKVRQEKLEGGGFELEEFLRLIGIDPFEGEDTTNDTLSAIDQETAPQAEDDVLKSLEGVATISDVEEVDFVEDKPIMELLADIQTRLGTGEILPTAGAVIGGGIVSAPGAAIGASFGQLLKQALGKQVEGKTGLDILPTKKDTDEAIKVGGVVGVSTILLMGAGKLLPKVIRPFKTAGDFRAAKIAEAQGKSISGPKIVTSLEKAQRTLSPTQQKSFSRFLEVAREQLKGPIDIDDAVKLNTEANKAFTQAGKVGKSATAAFNSAMGDSIKQQLGVVAPDVVKANKIFSLLFKAKKAVPALVGLEIGRRILRKTGIPSPL